MLRAAHDRRERLLKSSTSTSWMDLSFDFDNVGCPPINHPPPPSLSLSLFLDLLCIERKRNFPRKQTI